MTASDRRAATTIPAASDRAAGRAARQMRVALIALTTILVAGCSTRHDGVYIVQPGDSLSAIGERHGVGYRALAHANGIHDPNRIRPGQRLVIPAARDRRYEAHDELREPVHRAAPRPAIAASEAHDGALLWPVAGGTLSSPYGPRGSGFHEGIDIRAPVGTPVLAAERGVVTYSGYRRGYGNVVVVRHAPGLSTLYAHNHTNWVRAGQAVRRGEVVASVGETGRTSGANLHFEVWVGDSLADPLPYLQRPDPVVAGAEAR